VTRPAGRFGSSAGTALVVPFAAGSDPRELELPGGKDGLEEECLREWFDIDRGKAFTATTDALVEGQVHNCTDVGVRAALDRDLESMP